MILPCLARLSVIAEAGDHFLADITDGNGDVLITLDAEDDKALRRLCKILKKHRAEFDVAYDVSDIFAVVCTGMGNIPLREAAQITTEIFGDAYQQLATIYWYFVEGGIQLGARLDPAARTVTFTLPQGDGRNTGEFWRQFEDRVTDRFIGWESVRSGSKDMEVKLNQQRYAELEDALLELAGLFSFDR